MQKSLSGVFNFLFMGLENEVNELDQVAHTSFVGNAFPHRSRAELDKMGITGNSRLHTAEELAKRRAGEEALVLTRKADDEAGVSTMVRVSRELALDTLNDLGEATHEVLKGGLVGEKVIILGQGSKGRVRIQVLSNPRYRFSDIQISLTDLKEIPKVITNSDDPWEDLEEV